MVRAFIHHATLLALSLATNSVFAAPASQSPPSHAVVPKKPTCPPAPATPFEQIQIFNAYVATFYNATAPDPKLAMQLYVADDLIQHNPHISNGRAAQIAAVDPIYAESDFKVQNTFFDLEKGYGIIYNAVFPKGACGGHPVGCNQTTFVTDMYRFNGSCMVEHWDVLQEPEE